MNKYQAFPLFKGATRVPTLFGVPVIPLLSMVVFVAILTLMFGLIWWALVLPSWFLMRRATKHDDRAFRILGLWFETKFRNRHKTFWGASSYSPTDYGKRARIKK